MNDLPWIFNVTGVHREQHSGYHKFGENMEYPLGSYQNYQVLLQEMRGSANPMDIDLFHVRRLLK